jgi:hypothetical protein
MARKNSYVDLQGREWLLDQLDAEERQLVAELRDRAAGRPDWNDFDNYWTKAVAALYDARGLPRKQSRESAVYQIAQDLSNRLAIDAGMAQPPDYRDQLEEIIRTRFPTRRAFCEATGLGEDMLSHVLARRKHLALDTLTQALDRIGYVVRIRPRDDAGDPRTMGSSRDQESQGEETPVQSATGPNWDLVTREHVERACELVASGKEVVPPERSARSTFLIYKNRRYPGKFIRGLAYRLATGVNLPTRPKGYGGGRATTAFFRRLGFRTEHTPTRRMNK